MKKSNLVVTVKDNKVTYKRYFAVPANLAFEVWSTHEHLSQWWGPDGFTITTKKMNFTNGGTWEFIMHGPNGQDYQNRIRFAEIKEPHHIYYDHMGEGDDSDVAFQARVLFEAAGEGTNMTLEQIFPSKEELERINAKYGAIEGGKQHIGNFEKYIESIR